MEEQKDFSERGKPLRSNLSNDSAQTDGTGDVPEPRTGSHLQEMLPTAVCEWASWRTLIMTTNAVNHSAAKSRISMQKAVTTELETFDGIRLPQLCIITLIYESTQKKKKERKTSLFPMFCIIYTYSLKVLM